jgi:hypothetical protein
MSDSVHFRNARALDERNKQDRVRHDELSARVQHLERQLAMLNADMATMRQQVIMLIASRGSGPTVRE